MKKTDNNQPAQGANVAPATTAPKVAKKTARKGGEDATAKEKTKAREALERIRIDRARKVCQHIKEDAQSISGVLRSVWLRYAEADNEDATATADALAIAEDFKSVTGAKDMPASRREFCAVWLAFLHKHARAVNEDGRAVTLKTRAGYYWGEDFRPSLASCWSDVVANWVKNVSPLTLEKDRYYKGVKKGGRLVALERAPKTEARQAIQEADDRAKYIASEKAKAGKEAGDRFDGLKASEKA